jgi:hypothetical protein
MLTQYTQDTGGSIPPHKKEMKKIEKVIHLFNSGGNKYRR